MNIKDLKKVLMYFRMIRMFGYHNVIQRFEMKRVKIQNKFYSELFEGISDPESVLQVRLGSSAVENYITFEVFDTEKNEPVSIFSLDSNVKDSTMYNDWAVLSPHDDVLRVYDQKNKVAKLEISNTLGEDEHFQMMMERDMPEYENIQKMVQYISEVHPVLKEFWLYNYVQYNSLDVDYSKHIPHKEFIEEMFYNFPDYMESKGVYKNDT